MGQNLTIQVENLSKMYRIGELQPGYRTVKEAVAEHLQRPFRRTWNLLRGQHYGGAHLEEEIWALKNLSFQVEEGEVLGIIGRNGAGKSTLLRLLTRITTPTEGVIRIRGRVGALLEVGTGMHPELTGRENIFLSGSVMGMKRSEVKKKFDDIVEFSGIEKFIDTPVKHYSDGMRVRLGFSVSSQLEPEIMLVDEVLAVGDAAFQKKCLAKMREVVTQGRTVLFVSHNMSSIASLCDRAMWLEEGRIRFIGCASDAIARYMVASIPSSSSREKHLEGTPAWINDVRLVDSNGNDRESFDIFEPFTIEVDVVQRVVESPVRCVIKITSAQDYSTVLETTDWDFGIPKDRVEAGQFMLRCHIPENLINTGTYFLSVSLDEPRGPLFCYLENTKHFVIIKSMHYDDGAYVDRSGLTLISPYREWETVERSPATGLKSAE